MTFIENPPGQQRTYKYNLLSLLSFMFCCVYNAIVMSIQMPALTVQLSKDPLVSECLDGNSYCILC